MNLPHALLEEWMRDYYFDTDIDIGSSGVAPFTFAELRSLLRLEQKELDQVIFKDSQTLGGYSLRKAIADRWANGNRDMVMATHGSSEAIFLIINALLKPGDEIIVLHPSYQQLFATAESIGCILKWWNLRFEDGFRPNIDELKSLLTPRTRMLILNFPHNPTGATLSPAEREKITAMAADLNAYVVWDNAFTELIYENAAQPDRAHPYRGAIEIGTLSKAYGLPGLRIGWCIASPEILKKCLRIRDYITLHLSPLTELIAQRAIENGDVLVGRRLAQARTNLMIISAWAEENTGKIMWSRPSGGVTIFPKLVSVDNTEEFCRRLAAVERVLLVPGTCFNLPSHVRLGFGGDTAELKTGLSRLAASLEIHNRHFAKVAS